MNAQAPITELPQLLAERPVDLRAAQVAKLSPAERDLLELQRDFVDQVTDGATRLRASVSIPRPH